MTNPNEIDNSTLILVVGVCFALIQFLVLIVVGIMSVYLKWLGKSYLENKEAQNEARVETSNSLTRIETRMENIDKLRADQQHDHKAIRAIDELLGKLTNRVDNLEKDYTGIKKYCEEVHGNRL